MAERILEFLSNLLKVGKEQLLEKGSLLRNKVPIKPVLGLTGLGVLFIAVRPLFTNSNSSQQHQPAIESTIKSKSKTEQQLDEKDDVKKTLYLMRQKEKELKKQNEQQKQKS